MLLYFTLSIAAICLIYQWRRKRTTTARMPLPPGPRPLPIIGNVGEMPRQGVPQWLHWLGHKEKYGPISSITIFGQPIIILNEAQCAVDLLEKRSAMYSARPVQPFMEMTGWAKTMATPANTAHYAKMRKALHQEIGTARSFSRFEDMLDVEIRRLLLRVLETPGEVRRHLKKESCAVILKMTYGYTVEPRGDDPLVDLAEKAVDQICQAMLPGTWLVDYLPILKYVPPWFPGAGFVRTAEEYRKYASIFLNVPYLFVKKRVAKGEGKFTPCHLSRRLQSYHGNIPEDEEEVLKWSGLEFYLGGSDTTVSTMLSFIRAMRHYPAVQQKAQAEIDALMGPSPSRLPGLQDRDNLPYVNAVVKEALRWHPALPTASPHMSIKDDEYNGFFLPKGAVFVPNIWAYAHDPNTYPSPHEFKPERFLTHKPEQDPRAIVFGFGRRACPGQIMADVKVYLTIVRFLACFDITPKSKEGKQSGEEDLDFDLLNAFIPAILSHPKPFEVDIRIRSERYEELVRGVEVDVPWERSDAERIGEILNEVQG
ncbi:cytochrome P450 [Aspergillus undulatus]|uniref:cytochrome P450 n=1 Tax=Aspergillus undulatus TaxID=1810928 RepID=UPI003CCCC753